MRAKFCSQGAEWTLGRPYTEYEVHQGKQRIPSQVLHDGTNDDIPEVVWGV